MRLTCRVNHLRDFIRGPLTIVDSPEPSAPVTATNRRRDVIKRRRDQRVE